MSFSRYLLTLVAALVAIFGAIGHVSGKIGDAGLVALGVIVLLLLIGAARSR